MKADNLTQAKPATELLAGVLQRKCACGNHTIAGGECDECGKKRLQRRATNPAQAGEAPPIVHEVLSSPGQPLDAETRSFMEPRFGYDFSHVRIHTDARAADSASAVNALAYTVGRDVVFGAGQYAPGETEGRRLLAHELTHVVQQHQGASRGSVHQGRSDDPYEAEASRVAESLAQGETVRVTQESGPRLSRNGEPLREWGGFRIGGDADYVNTVRGHLNQLNATTAGRAVLQEITEYTRPFYRSYIPIGPLSACGFLPNSGISYNAGGCNVRNSCRGPNTQWNSVPNYVYLYHEVAHAYLYYIADKGTDPERECMVTGLGDYFTTIPHNENRLRCELGLPVRPCYDGVCTLPAPTCGQKAGQQQQQQTRGASEATMSRPYTPTR